MMIAAPFIRSVVEWVGLTLAVTVGAAEGAGAAALPPAVGSMPLVPAIEVRLWPEGHMPGPAAVAPTNLTVHQRQWKYTWVPEPGLAIHRPAGAQGVRPAVVICPGGGYGVLAYAKEGTEIAAWLNACGVTGLVLKYRVPHCREGALQDLQRAMRLARAHAAAWQIDPQRLGVMGFSAGGDLCVRLMAQGQRAAYPALDAADRLSARPDFALLVYPAFYDHHGQVDPAGRVEADLLPTAQTPPVFLVHTEDDRAFVNGTKTYVQGLQAVGVRHALRLYPVGGHGYGMRLAQKPDDLRAWPAEAAAWLRALGMVEAC